MKKEYWIPVKDYDGYYEISNLGNVRTVERHVPTPKGSYFKKQQVIKQHANHRGYLHVKLYKGDKNPKHVTVHKISALSFLNNLHNLKEVNHKDGNKLNNCFENLEWCTRSENVKHSYTLRNIKDYSGSNSKTAKLNEEKVLSIREQWKNKTCTTRQLAENYNVCISSINQIVNNKTWMHV